MADDTQTTDTGKTDTATADKTTDTKAVDTTKTADTGKTDAKTKTADWRAIPDDAPDREDLSKLVAKFTDPLAMFRAHAAAEKQVSRAIVPPGKDAKPDDIARYRRQIGVPEKPDDYMTALKLEVPAGVDLETEASKKLFGKVFEAAHAANVPPHALKPVVAAVLETVKAHHEGQAEEVKRAVEAADTKLRNEWRGDYDRNSEIGSRFLHTLPEEIKADMIHLADHATIDGVPFGEHPTIRKAFAFWGRQVGETQLAGMAMDPKEKQDAESQIDTLTKEALDARDKGDTETFKKKMAERDRLSTQLWG